MSILFCPVCRVGLKRFYHKGLFLDECENCNGVWIEKEEFKLFIDSFVSNPEIKPEKIALFKKKVIKNIYKNPEQPKLCPNCNVVMERFNYACDSNVFIDRCPQCFGFWLDKDEHIRIAQYLKSNPLIDESGKSILEQKQTIKCLLDINDALLNRRIARASGILYWLYWLTPVKDTTAVRIKPIMTYTLLIVNTFIFLYMFLINKNIDLNNVFSKYGFVTAFAFTEPERWISSMFIHASWGHIFFNMLFLWIFADNIEEKLGHLRFLLFYFLCGIISNAGYLFFDITGVKIIIGSSGAISGILGAYFYLFPRSKIKIIGPLVISAYMPAYWYLGAWFIIQILFSILPIPSNVGYISHIIGFLTGYIISILLFKKQNVL